MTERHKVFVSYHHDNDQKYRERFEELFSDVIASQSVDIGDIDPNANMEYVRQRIRDEYLRNSTVTVVLIWKQTWQRKYVDWEIYSSLRKTEKNPRSGLLGILLPTYPRPSPGKYNPHTVPPRLYDNVEKRDDGKESYADIYNWTDDPDKIQQRIHEAFQRRDKIIPINNRPMFGRNRTGEQWSD